MSKLPNREKIGLEELVLLFAGKRIMFYTHFQFFSVHAGLRGQSWVGVRQAAKTFLAIEVSFLAPLSSGL